MASSSKHPPSSHLPSISPLKHSQSGVLGVLKTPFDTAFQIHETRQLFIAPSSMESVPVKVPSQDSMYWDDNWKPLPALLQEKRLVQKRIDHLNELLNQEQVPRPRTEYITLFSQARVEFEMRCKTRCLEIT